MKTISTQLAASLGNPELTLATCWKATRTDGVVMGFTDHDSDLTINGLTYEASSGYTRSALQVTSTLAVDNLTLDAALDSSRITDADLRAGLWDDAEILIFLVDWTNPSAGSILLKRGMIGQVQITRPVYSAELRGLTQKAQQQIIELTSPGCRAQLGDARCRVPLSTLSGIGEVQSTTDWRHFADASRSEATGYWNGGLLTFTSGANTGISMEVTGFTGETGLFELYLPMGRAIAVADAYLVTPGCDRQFTTCQSKFNNAVNFRGECLLPGLDQILLTPSAS